MDCPSKHTKYQPTDDEWKCPKCGAGNEAFWIEEDSEDSTEDCTLLHDAAELRCSACGFYSSGKQFASRWQKVHDLVDCPCCKGKGLVNKAMVEIIESLLEG